MDQTVTDAPASCMDMFLLARNWDDWMDSLRETITTAREIDPSEPHLLAVTEDVIDFLTSRVHSGSPVERRVAEIWDRASLEERTMLIRCFIEEVESRTASGP